jgi:hypothetical protein
MANRVTATEVKVIFDTQLDDAIIDVFIIPANILTDKVEAADVDNTLTTDQLKEIERWLSAHFTGIRDTRVSNEKAGPVGQGFQYKVDLNLNLTMYGGTAITLDTTGYLASLQKQAEDGQAVVASVSALGPVSSADIAAGVYDGQICW